MNTPMMKTLFVLIPFLMLALLPAAPTTAQAASRTLEDTRAAAEKGDADAQVALAAMYDEGTAIPRDADAAFSWLKRAAQQGHVEAQYLVGKSLDAGNGVLKDEVEGLAWRRKSAEGGYGPAQTELGYQYAYGFGVQRNDTEAAKWFTMAAEQNNHFAQNFLGEAYTLGKGVARSDRAAQGWFMAAAAQGNMAAQFNLGLLYLNTAAQTKLDTLLGHMWLELAARQGDGAAAIALGNAAARMSKADITKAKKLAEACRAAKYKDCAK
jgi:TPR repeat protein